MIDQTEGCLLPFSPEYFVFRSAREKLKITRFYQDEEIKEDELWDMQQAQEECNMHTEFYSGTSGKIILRWNLRKYGVRMWIGFMWLYGSVAGCCEQGN